MILELIKYKNSLLWSAILLCTLSCIQKEEAKEEVKDEEIVGKIDFKGLTAVNDDSLDIENNG